MSRLLPDLKQQILRDNTAAFTAPGGFSEKMEIVYQEKSRRIWAQMEEEGTAVRDKKTTRERTTAKKPYISMTNICGSPREILGSCQRL